MKRLLLLGGGPAHLQVLRALSAEALPGVEVTFASPAARVIHAPMLPGHVAGDAGIDECSVPLAPLAERAGVSWLQAGVSGLDPRSRTVTLADGRSLPYDALSLEPGATIDRDAIPGAREHGLFVRPVDAFATLWERMRALAETRSLCVVVIGAGREAAEMALAMHQRLGDRSRISLVTGGGPAASDECESVRRRIAAVLRRGAVTVLEDGCSAVTAEHVLLASGTRVACDAAVIATAAIAPTWLRASGLALDAGGGVATGPTLQCAAHPEVFAVGEAAAAEAGEALALNLRRFLAGGALAPWSPPVRRLRFVASGSLRAIVTWGEWSLEGRWVGRWKARRERAFLQSFTGSP